MKLILGSSSPRRQDIMRSIDRDTVMMPVDIDEKAIRRPNAQHLTSAIAIAKAHELRSRVTEPAVLVVADSVVVCDGVVREKPGDASEARRFLESYRTLPSVHVVSVVVSSTVTGKDMLVVDEATVWFKDVNDELIQALITDGKIFTSAGAVLIEHPLFAGHVDRIEGHPETVLGLPSYLVRPMIQYVQEV